MRVVAAYKPLGALAVLVLIVGLLFLVLRWPQGTHKTFSQHAAAQRRTVLYYMVLFTVALPLLLLFFVDWFAPAFRLSPWFLAFIVASAALQYAVTIIPETGGWRTTVHRFLTFWSALFLLPPLLFVLFSHAVGPAGRWVALLGLLVMAGIMGVFAFSRGNHRYVLFLQAGYYAAFFTVVLFATYP
jgi:hypothetical protein